MRVASATLFSRPLAGISLELDSTTFGARFENSMRFGYAMWRRNGSCRPPYPNSSWDWTRHGNIAQQAILSRWMYNGCKHLAGITKLFSLSGMKSS